MSNKNMTNLPQQKESLICFDSQVAKSATLISLNAEQQTASQCNDRVLDDQNTPIGCSLNSIYDDIIYHPQTRSFWLLTDNAANTLGESAKKFSKAVSMSNPDERLAAFSDFKITEMFVSPRIQEFLTESERQKYELISSQIKTWQAELDKIKTEKKSFPNFEKSTEFTGIEITNNYNISLIEKDKIELEEKAIKIAESKGYIIQDSRIYTPNQIKIKELLDEYQDSIDTISDFTGDKYQTIFEYIGYYQNSVKQISDNINSLSKLTGDVRGLYIYEALLSWKQSNAQDALQTHAKLITELANLGIAVPEFAFCQNDPEQGLKNYLNYMAILEEIETKKQKLNDEFESWVKALGNNAKNVPTPVFDEDVTEILTLREEAIQKRQEAEKQIESLSIPMLCVWDASQFAPKSVDFLFKAIKPLQEYSSPKELKLSHIAVQSLSEHIEEDLTNLVITVLLKVWLITGKR